MNIGQASKACGLPAKTIRYYETINLVVAERRDNGYRFYTAEHLGKLSFLRRARKLGFSIAECRLLLSVYQDKGRANAEILRIAETRLDRVDLEIRELQAMRDLLRTFVGSCHGDDRFDIAVLHRLQKPADRSCRLDRGRLDRGREALSKGG